MEKLHKMSDAKYFQTTKRGEIHELKEELHQLDKSKQKEVRVAVTLTRCSVFLPGGLRGV